jgi:hypothetical protein
MDIHLVANVSEYRAIAAGPEFGRRFRLERGLAAQHRDDTAWTMRGQCLPCGEIVNFVVDNKRAKLKAGDLRVPRWRETIVCPSCRLNNRQRAMAHFAREVIDGIDTPSSDDLAAVYVLEQVTPFFEWCKDSLPAAVIGSEYLGPDHLRGEAVEDLRHEDLERLSFPDASFDLIISNDVHEHVPDPVGGLRELARVLKPGGTLLMSTPLRARSETSVTRAVIEGGHVRDLLPAVYHDNPLTPKGSLVFTDFGWDLLTWMEDSGLESARLQLFWSLEHGHLGRGGLLRAVRASGHGRAGREVADVDEIVRTADVVVRRQG